MALVRLHKCALASEPAIPAYICVEYQNLMTMSMFLSVHFQVHVAKHKVEVYNQIQEFQDNFTRDGSSTQIHACGKEVVLVHRFR